MILTDTGPLVALFNRRKGIRRLRRQAAILDVKPNSLTALPPTA